MGYNPVVSVEEARRNLGDLATSGEPVVITKNGIPVAVIQPARETGPGAAARMRLWAAAPRNHVILTDPCEVRIVREGDSVRLVGTDTDGRTEYALKVDRGGSEVCTTVNLFWGPRCH